MARIMFDIYIRKGFLIVAIISGIPLVLSSLMALIVSVAQTVTQIQDSSITYLVKFVTVSSVIFFFSDWLSQQMIDFFQELLASIALLGRL